MKKQVCASLLALTLFCTSFMPQIAYADEATSNTLESVVTETETTETETTETETTETEATETEATEAEAAETETAEAEAAETETKQTPTEAFVTRVYETILLRSPDKEGLKFWVDMLSSKNKTGADIISGFISSKEFRSLKYSDEKFIEIMYRAILDRTPDKTGKANWLSILEAGHTRMYVCSGFVNSIEFRQLCASYGIAAGSIPITSIVDKKPQITEFMVRLYRLILSRRPDPVGLEDWVTKLSTKKVTAAEVISGFIKSKEFTEKNLSDGEFIEILYKTLLDRTADKGGKANWVEALESGLSQNYVLFGFVQSAEFHKLCASYNIEAGSIPVTEARDKNRTLTKYVNDTYKTCFGRPATADELNNWCSFIMTKPSGIKEFIKSIIFADGSKNNVASNTDFIKTLYICAFGRNASAQEIDHWLQKLSTMSRAQVVDAITSSPEFIAYATKIGFPPRVEGWNITSSGRYYVLNGKILSGWQRLGGKRYYFNPSNYNYAATGWNYIGGYKYYFNSEGILQQNVDSIIGKQSSYRLTVNTSTNVVTVYAKDGNNGYIIPVKSIICSTGRSATPTIKGTFTLRNRWRWLSLMGGVWGQYVTQISGSYLFHSAWYYSTNIYTLSVSEYRKLGTNASHGCVRLTVGDAKWIYDNCIGSTVTVTTSCAQPFDKPVRPNPVVVSGDRGYDPTDPNI